MNLLYHISLPTRGLVSSLNYVFEMRGIASLLAVFLTVQLSAQCIEDTHSPFPNQGWESCQTSLAPAADRGDVHWLQYDLGETYALQNLHIWNHNVWGELDKGVKEIYLDFSLDGNNWTSAGPYTIEQAPGSWKYQGYEVGDLGNVLARYVLISVASTWGESNCAGLAEVRFGLGEVVNTDDVLTAAAPMIVYPNPASQEAYVQLTEQDATDQLLLIDATGRVVQQLAVAQGPNTRIDVRNLPTGLYHVQYLGVNGTRTTPLVVE